MRRPQTLPVRTDGWVPKVGEVVLAVGFPELEFLEIDQAKQSRLLTEGMYGAYGRIVAVHEQGTSTSNPSPVFEVESDWPPGMSGGPVFNSQGEVVGIVSRSLRAESDHAGTGYAVHLGLAHDIELLAPNLDRSNPGWRKCWGLFTSAESAPIDMLSTKEAAELAASAHDRVAGIREIANRIGTTDFVDLT